MLLGGDLWFLVRVVVAGFTVVFLPLFGLVVRQKWRRSAARREEVKRLLVLASEEAARAEVEANREYGYGGISYGQEDVEPEMEPEPEVKEERVVPAEVEVPVTDHSTIRRRTQNQCEVCSRPTTTRCAQCKKVYYWQPLGSCAVCTLNREYGELGLVSWKTSFLFHLKSRHSSLDSSGKCQIIHWRQGHKDECRPFGTSDQNYDVPPRSNPLIPPENGSYQRSIDVGGRHPVKPVESHFNDYSFSDSNVVKAVHGNDNNEVLHLRNETGRNSNLMFVAQTVSDEHSEAASIGKSAVNVSANDVNNCNLSDRHQHVHRDPDETSFSRSDRIKPVSSEYSCVSSSVDRVDTFKHNLVKPSPLHGGSQSGTSSSSLSGSSVDECNESSFSEPSTPSSGFWEGMNNFNGARNDDLDDTAYSSFDGTSDVGALDSHLCPSSSALTGRLLPSVNSPVSHVKKKVPSDIPPAISGTKESIDGRVSSVEINNYVVQSQKLSVSERSAAAVDDISSKMAVPGKSMVLEMGKDAKVSIPPSVLPDKSKCEVRPGISTFREPTSDEVKPLLVEGSGVCMSSGVAKQTVENVKSANADNIHVVPAFKSDFYGQQKDRISSKASVWKVVDQIKASKLARLNPLVIASENVGRYSDKGLFQYELFVKLYNWNKVELVPCGFMNCGNSCFANVVLQCLAFTPPLTAYFLQGLHSPACKKRDWCFTCEFEGLLLKAKEGHSPISPSRIISKLQNIGSHLGNGREEDAHEFLRYAIDAMQSICLKEAGVSAASSSEETTLIGLTFGGYLRSKIECMRCGGISERQEKMMDLTVEIEGDIGTLEEALRQFTRSETLDGENKYQCGRCKSFEKARKKLRVLEAPNVLTIALKRFQSGKFGKLNKTIKFPEILNMAPYMSGTSDKSPVYRLYGVVVHLDIMHAAFSGHYVCYIKNSQNRWFKTDDSKVKPVEPEKVLTKGAYMLFYARCSPRAPRLLRSSLNPRESRKAKDTDCKSRNPSRHQRDMSPSDLPSSSRHNERSCLSRATIQPIHTFLEDDSSSDSSSFFSEVNSCSTDSSTKDSTSADSIDHIFGDVGAYWDSLQRNSSDSETLSSASSPSPMYLRHSSHAGSDHYASKGSEMSVLGIDAAGSAVVGRPRHRGSHQLEAKGSVQFLCPESTKHRRSVGGSSSSCGESSSSKLGSVNSLDNLKSSVPLR